MKITRRSSYAVWFLTLFASTMSASQAALVVLDSATKIATSDTKTLAVTRVKAHRNQIRVDVENTAQAPQTFVLKVKGLTGKSYDVYINPGPDRVPGGNNLADRISAEVKAHTDQGQLLSNTSVKQLEDGFEFTVPSSVADPVLLRSIASVKAGVDLANEGAMKNLSGDSGRAHYTLRQAVDWVNGAIDQERVYRLVRVVIVPPGEAIRGVAPERWRMDETGVSMTLTRVCGLLQNARSTMYGGLEEPNLRNAVVAGLTPVFLTAQYSHVNGKLRATAHLINDCDLPVSGSVSMTAPIGWKIAKSTKPHSTGELKSGKSFDVSFDLLPSAKAAKIPAELPIIANVTIERGDLFAKFDLKAMAKEVSKAK